MLQIVQMTAVDPGLHVVALEAISHVVTDSGMHPSAFKPCFDNIQMLLERTKVGSCAPARTCYRALHIDSCKLDQDLQRQCCCGSGGPAPTLKSAEHQGATTSLVW